MVFTIAIPTYNNAQIIEKAILSGLGQDFEHAFEVLVVNNNSTDDTRQVLGKYEGKIRVVTNSETVSMYENHNVCLNEAKGDYVIFCHSDDYLLPDTLTKFYGILKAKRFPKKIMVWGRSFYCDYYTNWAGANLKLNEIASGIHALGPFIIGGGVTPSGTCYSRASFTEIGGFINSQSRLSPSDWVTPWKMVLKHFEFQMSERIFFNRAFASTAVNVRTAEQLQASKDVLDNFFSEITPGEKKLFLAFITQSRIYNLNLYLYLKEQKLIRSSVLKKNVIVYLIKNPRQFSFRLLKFILS